MKPADGKLTLAIDIGGTHIKASVLDPAGALLGEPKHLDTPRHATPKAVLAAIETLVQELPAFDRVSVGFPGYVRDGRVFTAPNLSTKSWAGFQLDDALAERLKKPARVRNDADVQGLGVIDGTGLECVMTLGTGIGFALFLDGRLLPHLELGQHPVVKDLTYDHYLGDAVLQAKGKTKWNHRLRKVLSIVDTLVNYDLLHLGGGNARCINFKLPKKVKLAANIGGITGGIRLWDEPDQIPGAKKPNRPNKG